MSTVAVPVIQNVNPAFQTTGSIKPTVATGSVRTWQTSDAVRPQTMHARPNYIISEKTHPRLSDIDERVLARTLLGVLLTFAACVVLWMVLFTGIATAAPATGDGEYSITPIEATDDIAYVASADAAE